MQIKIRKPEKKINDLETNHLFAIPKEIEEKIKERGFYLYNWIGEKDVKESIERDFLSFIKYVKGGLIRFLFFILVFLLDFGKESGNILMFVNDIIFLFKYILIFSGLGSLIFIFLVGIYKILFLKNNKYILITNDYILINGEIQKIENYKFNYSKKIQKIEKTFNEKIFDVSKIPYFKRTILNDILNKTFEYERSSKPLGDIIFYIFKILMNILILPFILLLYFCGIFIIWLFGVIYTIINKHIHILLGHKITKINDNFENIDNYSNGIVKEKNNLENLLKEAINNNWKDSLLIDINKKLEIINEFASKSINSNIELKSDIENSDYKEMFNFITYNSWIKKQITIPLEQIKILLLKNLETLNKQNNDIVKQLENENDPSKSGPLLASKRRIEMRIEEIQIHIEKMSLYINKLK